MATPELTEPAVEQLPDPKREGRLSVGASLHLYGDSGLLTARFVDEATRRDLRFARFLQRPTESPDTDAVERLGVLLARRETPAMTEWLLELDPYTLAEVTERSGDVTLSVTAASPELAERGEEKVAALFEPREDDPSSVPTTFWSWTDDGGEEVHRRVTCEAWTDIEASYCDAARRSMARLVKVTDPTAGRLVLWHGPPGTGKTHAIRALARAWQEWCVPHVVTDPEKFLGDSSYAMNVLGSGDLEPDRDREWHLVVLEDSGELLRADAHERNGQAMSRLLNLTDGLLGQGMNALALITTNEPVGRLHPAVTRPGRCLEEVEFGPLSAIDANRWLAERGSSERVTKPTTLASLYALVNGHNDPSAVEGRLPRFGFAAAA